MEKKENSKKLVLYSGLLVSSLTLLGLFVSYAWAVNVRSENEIVEVETANNLKLIYKDCNSSNEESCSSINKDLEPGESVEKIFEVTNTSPRDLSFNLYFKELFNSFLNDDLVYKIENTTTNEVLVAETPLRFSELKLYDLIIKQDINIKANSTDQYKLTVTFLNKEENQNYNLDASYSLKLTIGNYKKDGIVPKIVASIMDKTPLPEDESLKINETPDFGKTSPIAKEYMEFVYSSSMEINNADYEVVYAESYTFDNQTGKFSLVNPQTCKYSECLETIKGKYSIDPYNWINDGSEILSSIGQDRETENINSIIKIGNYSTENEVKYQEISSTFKSFESQDGIYTKEDDYGTSYYFRGSGQDNYVKFGGFYWRIIRINGDGSLRIIFDGTKAHLTGDYNDNDDRVAFKSPFNENYADAKYVGYMYGPAGTGASTSKEEAQTNTESSTIKINLEKWYVDNIKNKGLDQYVADSIFCNDRSIPGKDITGWEYDTGLGYGTNTTEYGAVGRFIDTNSGDYKVNANPIFTCPNKNDAFTVNDTEKGNGSLSEKIGLITADEIVAAGNILFSTNLYNYLANANRYWSLSPFSYNGFANVFYVNSDGGLSNRNVYNAGGVAPVISLSAEYVRTMEGNGTATSPYELRTGQF